MINCGQRISKLCQKLTPKIGVIPQDLDKTTIVTIYKKKKGEPEKCENHNGISITSHVVKIYDTVLEKRKIYNMNSKLGEEQFGYRKNRSTSDLMFSHRLVIENSWDLNKRLFTDLKKRHLTQYPETSYGSSWKMSKKSTGYI